MDKNARVAIIGAGLMGHGLALVHAAGGHRVALYDISAEQLDTAVRLIEGALGTLADGGAIDRRDIDPIRQRIAVQPDLRRAVADADLVVEAVVEDVEVKRQVYADLDTHAQADAVIASNTSYLDVFPLIPERRQTRCLITHWYTPPYIIDLVDLAPGPETEPSLMEAMRTLSAEMGKKPVLFERFVSGYVANRLQSAMALEITRLLDEGWATAEGIDDSIKYGLAARMATMGALMKADFTGLDMTRRAMANRTYDPPEPKDHSPVLDRLLAEGRRGVMSGADYFDYGDMNPGELFRNRDLGLLRLKATVAEVEDAFPLRPI